MNEETVVPEEKIQVDESTEPVKDIQPEKGIEAIKWLFKNVQPKMNLHGVGRKKRGVGVTRKNKEQTKKARKQSKKSRRINGGK
jgi:hypothetical protein